MLHLRHFNGRRPGKSLMAGMSALLLLSGCGSGAPVDAPVDVDTPPEVIVEASLIDAAVNDTARPADHREADSRRMPAELLAFADISPGDRVGDFIPGGGYWTRLLATSTGPTGKVYAFTPDPSSGQPQLEDIASDAVHYANVDIRPLVAGAIITSPEPLDVVWTSQNYHDLKNLPPPVTTPAINAMLFAMLKPGGLYIVMDHSAASDAPDEVTDTLHRIREALVREEIEAAGFVFVAETKILRNPSDARDLSVFDDAIRGHTDQFVHKYRKPE